MNGAAFTRRDEARILVAFDGLGDESPVTRAAAALDLRDELRAVGITFHELLTNFREWGRRPDVHRAAEVLAREFAEQAGGRACAVGFELEAIEFLQTFARCPGPPHPGDFLRALGLIAVAFGTAIDPDVEPARAADGAASSEENRRG